MLTPWDFKCSFPLENECKAFLHPKDIRLPLAVGWRALWDFLTSCHLTVLSKEKALFR